MSKYVMLFNIDGTDYLNPNVFETSPQQADEIAHVTTTNFDLDFSTLAKVQHPSILKANVLTLPDSLTIGGQRFPLAHAYLGYYYDENTQQYYLDEQAVTLTSEQCYDHVFETLNQNHALNHADMHNDDVETVVIGHEGGVIELDHATLEAFRNRLLEN